jgi:hypothetical protein
VPEEPSDLITVVSTTRLCEMRHITARIVASCRLRFIELIAAIAE